VNVKSLGYSISIVSVILLAIPTVSRASEEPLLFACLLGGMVASVIGMILRWASHARDKRARQG
jgi:hypothetical protein